MSYLFAGSVDRDMDADGCSHPHLYGIDVASTSELIAHSKSNAEIAEAIGAEQIIYQTLDDLKFACASASPESKVEGFEVGVFCGEYITPVREGYFEHLENVRRRTRRMKEQEIAKAKIVNGVAEEEDVRVAAGFDDHTARGNNAKSANSEHLINGGGQPTLLQAAEEMQQQRVVNCSQDISLSNLNDHE